MHFNSFCFILFLAIVLIFRLINKNTNCKQYRIFISLFSTFFYAWNAPIFLLILLFIAYSSYQFGGKISKTKNLKKAKYYLFGNIVCSLSVLMYYKYLINILNSLSTDTIFGIDINILYVVVPIGISFYVFQSISYTVDLYRKRIDQCESFLNYYLYLSFFPQLIAGPIVKAKEFLYQIDRDRRLNLKVISAGFFYLISGFFLKVVIADNISFVVDKYWHLAFYIENGNLLSVCLAWLFGIQILADFSGYSYIALGIGYLLGFRLPANFNFPYIANSFSEFWKRWHISLSTWLKDYLYIPLGGNRYGKYLTYRNLFIVMALGGLWHGGSLNFLLWGIIHGIALIFEKIIINKYSFLFKAAILRSFYYIAVQFVVMVAWIFFRTAETKHALLFVRNILLGWNSPNLLQPHWNEIGKAFLFSIPVILSHLYALYREKSNVYRHNKYLHAILAGWMLVAILTFYGNSNPFIYFNF